MNILKSLVFAASAIALASTAHAVEPVVNTETWTGSLSRSNYTKVFTSITSLAQLKECAIEGETMKSASMSDEALCTSLIKESTDSKLVLQFQLNDYSHGTDKHLKYIDVEFIEYNGGIGAKELGANYVNNGGPTSIGTLQTNIANAGYYIGKLSVATPTVSMPYCFHLNGDVYNMGGLNNGTVATKFMTAKGNGGTFDNRGSNHNTNPIGVNHLKVNSNTSDSYYIEDANGLVTFEKGWTLSAWIKMANTAVWGDVFGFNLGDHNFKMERISNTKFHFYRDGTENSVEASFANGDTWFNVIITSNKGNKGFTVYVNGALAGTWDGTWNGGAIDAVGVTKLILGGNGLTRAQNMSGSPLIDEVALFDGVLSSNQIEWLSDTVNKHAPSVVMMPAAITEKTPETTIDGEKNWSDLVWDTEVKSSLPVKLNVTDDSVLTIDQNLDFLKITVAGAGDLTIDNTNGFTIPTIDANGLSGTVTIKTPIAIAVNAGSNKVVYEYTGTTELTPAITTTGRITLGGTGTFVLTAKPTSELSIAKDATVKINHGNADALNGVKIFGSGLLVFNGNGNGGDLLNIVKCSFDSSWTGTVELNRYTGGNDRTAFLMGNANSLVRYVNCEGWLRPNSDPQVSGATGYEMNVELVDNGGTALKIINGWSGWSETRWIAFNKLIGTGTFMHSWSQANPGNPIVVRDLSEFEGTLAMSLPANKCAAIIVSKTATYATVTQTDGNGRIIICTDGVANVAKGKTWTAVNGIVVNGTIGGEGTLGSATTFGEGATLDLDKGALSVSGTLTLPSQIKLAVTKPEHAMTVLNVPAGFTETSCKALVGEKVCDLFLEGSALKLKWKIPPTIEVEADDVTVDVADDWNGGVVKVNIGKLTVGNYAGDIRYLLRFGGKVVEGSAQDASASFNLDPSYFTAGNIYRGTFELEYGTGNEPIVAAEVTVYAGEKTYSTKEGWINERPEPLVFRSTGVYNPEDGVSVESGSIKFANPNDVVFTPTNSPADYVAKCDSEVTFEIFSGEEAIPDDDDTVADDLQAGVKIVDDGNGGAKFQFISGDAWINGPAAALNKTYTVTVNFHYAKEEGDTDSVTYTVGETVLFCARRANVAEKLETISFSDGTQIGSLVGTCQIEVADPVTKGMEPGADEKELKATDEATAEEEASKIPVVVPSEVAGGITEGLDDEAAKQAKEDYKANFQVVAQKGAGDKWVAVVVPTAVAEKKIEEDVKELSEDVITKVVAIPAGETEGTATISEAVPGFFYGVAENGEVVNMKTAEPDEWKMAGASGKVELKVTKPANAKARFYKVICSPLPKK